MRLGPKFANKKNPESLPNCHENWSSSHGIFRRVLLKKFHSSRANIVDLLLMADYGPGPILSAIVQSFLKCFPNKIMAVDPFD